MSRRSLRFGIQFTIALGGVAALSWEVLWQLEASLSLGISAVGTALTLAATMGGMTAGSLAMGRALGGRSGMRPLLLYGALEAIIGVSGLALLPGFAWIERIDSSLYGVAPSLAPITHLLSIALLLGPPTLAMGATLPVFALISRQTDVSLARLYGINTAGAAAGVLLLSFVLVPNLGVGRTCLAVAGVNAAVLVATRLLQRLGVAPAVARAASVHAAPRPGAEPLLGGSGAVRLIVFGTGFITFALEVAWFRSLRAAFQSTQESFAIILASVLIALAAAARLVPRLRNRGVTPRATLALAAAAILLATPLVERVDLMVHWSWSYALMLTVWAALSLAILGPPILLLGTALPWYLEQYPGPRSAGQLYAVNTLGAVAGALVAAWLLLPSVGFARCAWLMGIACALLSLLAAGRTATHRVLLATGACLALAMSFTSSLGRDRVQSPHDVSGHRILAFDEGPDSTIAVLESPGGVRQLMIDGFTATSEQPGLTNYMEWMGRLPMILHPDPRRAPVICFGTGQTANAVRREQAEHVDVVDVESTVFELAPFFSSNQGVLEDSRVNPVVMDGRAWLRRVKTDYDVITLEPMPPYFAGSNALYSREFYEIMAERLAPGGIVAQWLPTHLLPVRFAASVATTFQSVFPDALLWIDPGETTGILLGRRRAASAALIERWPGLRRAVPRPLGGRTIIGAARLDAEGVRRYGTRGQLITDDNQLLAYGLVRRELVRNGFRAVAKDNLVIIRGLAGKRALPAPSRRGVSEPEQAPSP